MKTTAGNLPLSPSDFFALPLQARAASSLRSETSRALRSRVKIGTPLQWEVETFTTNP